jgi:hypothetical protein
MRLGSASRRGYMNTKQRQRAHGDRMRAIDSGGITISAEKHRGRVMVRVAMPVPER